MRAAGVVGVFEEVEGLLQAAGAQVHGHVRFDADGAAELHELAEPELVGLGGAPGEVQASRPVLLGAHAVFPAVAGDEVPAGVADHRRAELADEVQDVLPETVVVRRGVVGFVDAGVDAPAKVLHEGPEQALGHLGHGEARIELDARAVVLGHSRLPEGLVVIAHRRPSRVGCEDATRRELYRYRYWSGGCAHRSWPVEARATSSGWKTTLRCVWPSPSPISSNSSCAAVRPSCERGWRIDDSGTAAAAAKSMSS